MRCRDARRRESRRRLAPRDAIDRALARHLDACAECAAWVRAERELTAGLAALREELPFPVDVTGRVLGALATERPAAAEEPRGGQLGRAAAAAVICSVALAIAGRPLAPELLRSAREGWIALSRLAGAWERSRAALRGIGSVTLDSLGRLAADLGGALGGSNALQTAAAATVAVLTAAMMATIYLVVRRDFARIGPREDL